MFLMWIFPLVLIGLVAYGLSGNNLAWAIQPASNRTCPHCSETVQHDG